MMCDIMRLTNLYCRLSCWLAFFSSLSKYFSLKFLSTQHPTFPSRSCNDHVKTSAQISFNSFPKHQRTSECEKYRRLTQFKLSDSIILTFSMLLDFFTISQCVMSMKNCDLNRTVDVTIFSSDYRHSMIFYWLVTFSSFNDHHQRVIKLLRIYEISRTTQNKVWKYTKKKKCIMRQKSVEIYFHIIWWWISFFSLLFRPTSFCWMVISSSYIYGS